MNGRASEAIGVAIGLWFLAALVATSITLAFVVSAPQHLLVIVLRAPGASLVTMFHAAAFYVPLVLCVAAGLVLRRSLDVAALITVGLSVFPFLGLALVCRLAFTDQPSLLTSALLRTFSAAGATAIAVVATVLLGAVVAVIGYRLRERTRVFGRGARRIRALLAAPSAYVASAGDASSPQSLVDLPEPSAREPDLAEPSGPELEPEPYTPVEQDDLTVLFSDGHFLMQQSEPWEEDSPDDAEELYEAEDLDDADDPVSDPPARVSPRRRSSGYHVPVDGILDVYQDHKYWLIDDSTRAAAETLRITLEEFNIQAEVTGIRKGPVITMFEILPAPGVKLNKIVNLADNIALRLAASSVRIVAPIPGKHAVGIEIPNRERAIVGFAELLQDERFTASRNEIPIALGKDIPGDAQIIDLTKTPHVLIAGATGSGKSVCVNSIICSILYRRSPAEVKMILIDPKIVELKFYNDTPHLLTPVITDPKKAFQALQYCIYEMERRYSLLDALQVRDIQSYNRKVNAKRLATEPIPYIVVVVDEFADLMATSGKELESTLARLAAMSRAVGIHLVLATQRPSTDVITGLIKANIPSRIAFMVASRVDSRIIIDVQGAEKLLGRGDMLFTSAWDPFPIRMQGAFLSEEEVERVVEHVKTLGAPEYIDDEIFVEDEDEEYAQGELEDPLMEKAIEIVVSARKASASYLQRRLKIGYNRAARMVEEMERVGIVGPQQGSKPREVIGSAG